MRLVNLAYDADEDPAYEEAGARLKAGKLVAFPTETVYGLGGNGLDAAAVAAIYDMKRRPANDPVILHVNHHADAMPLWNLQENDRELISALQDAFWPGPLTIVAPASDIVPDSVTAGTKRVAVRSPAHMVARRMIDAAGCPVAAPSANLFSRISPTKAEHVQKYFGQEDLLLLACDEACNFGIESSVIEVADGEVRELRSGAVTVGDLRKAFDERGLGYVVIKPKTIMRKAAIESDVQSSAPGQCLVHYAPSLTTYLVIGEDAVEKLRERELDKAAILDLSCVCSASLLKLAAYSVLIQRESPNSTANRLFESLHEIEDQSGAEDLYICMSSADANDSERAGVLDRVIRAAAHKVL